jgi:hypothetical protein
MFRFDDIVHFGKFLFTTKRQKKTKREIEKRKQFLANVAIHFLGQIYL